MKVSVVVPCYNHGPYVGRCLAAIDEQEWADLEVIVVDDGSRDTSWERVSAYRWRPGRAVQTVRTENRGAHAAINCGLELATGEYVALCNSDDYFAPGRIATLVGRMRESASRFAFSGVRFVDDNDVDVGQHLPYARDLRQKQADIAKFPSVGFAIVLSNVAISTGNFLFERSLLSEIGYFRPYRYCHDWDFLLRALLVAEPLFVPELLYCYRLHPRNSFTELDDAAAWECPELMRRFMKATLTDRHPNRLAPSPRNWPGYFAYFVEEYGYEPYLGGWDDVDGVFYRPTADNDRSPSPEPRAQFGQLTDPEWLEVLVRSLRERTIDGVEMPGFPADATQVLFTSMQQRDTLEEAYAFFGIVKEACRRHGRPIKGDTQLLDFGVGWGRIARVFLKDIAGRNVFGVDVNEDILRECQQLLPYGTYSLCRNGGRLEFPDARFDVIVAFSVFSHLSPAAHLHWLKEFHRVLGPRGTVVLTTLSRHFLDYCVRCAEHPTSDLERHIGELVTRTYPDWAIRFRSFPDTDYLYLPSGGGISGLDPEHYGWAMVTERYARDHWSDYFEITDFVDDPQSLPQAYFVLRKRATG